VSQARKRVWAVLLAALVLLSCEGDKPLGEPQRVRDLQMEDIESFKGKTVGEILDTISDSVKGMYISDEPPGYLHSVSYYYTDGYSLDLLLSKPRYQPRYSENLEWDTVRLRLETVREASLRHHLEILYGRRFY